MNQKLHIIFVRLGLLQPAKVMYVGGSDVLPPPLPGPQEQQLLLRLAQGDHTARQCLIEHNLRLVVYIARRFENTGVNLEDLDLHRDHRAHQSRRDVPSGQKDQAGNLRLPLH